MGARRNTYTKYVHIDPTGIPDGSRALVNRHEINSRKETVHGDDSGGLERKNRKTRGGVGARGRLIYSGYSGGGAQRMLGV